MLIEESLGEIYVDTNRVMMGHDAAASTKFAAEPASDFGNLTSRNEGRRAEVRANDPRIHTNLFVYLLEHPSREEARKNWAAFQADLEWQKVKADSETNGALANHIDSYFMDPTSFSALK